MADPDALPLLIHRIHMNQIMLGPPLRNWRSGPTNTAIQTPQSLICRRLATLEAHADFISEAIVDLMADP